MNKEKYASQRTRSSSSLWSFVIVLIILFSTFILLSTPTQAVQINKQYSFTLLSVSHADDGTMVGGTAQLLLSIKPGTGAIFIESYPTAKVDTQTATRLANEIACEYSTVDCDQYDFFYTIRAQAPLVEGPSAGGATALLTLAALEDIDLKPRVAMTGAISSGGMIMPIAGLPEKVSAAEQEGMNIVLIPYFNIVTNETKNKVNETIQEILSSENKTLLSINTSSKDIYRPFVELSALQSTTSSNTSRHTTQVIPVKTIFEALRYVAKKPLPQIEERKLIPDKAYEEQMKTTAELLCERTKNLTTEVREKNATEHQLSSKINIDRFTDATDFYNKSLFQKNQTRYYPQASYCYSANLDLRNILLSNMSNLLLQTNYKKLLSSINKVDKQIENRTLRTFSDLETYSIIKERLLEAKDTLQEINYTNISSTKLSQAIERYYSAIAWSGFFGLPGRELDINKENLHLACSKEIENVESRKNYLKTIMSEEYLKDIDKNLQYAYKYEQDKEYALCLFKASKTKADANLFISSMNVQNSSVIELVTTKQERTKEILLKDQEQNIFPILGYSYYDYVNALEKDDVSSALVFSEYALALSDVQDYFPKEQNTFLKLFQHFNKVDVGIFLTGFFIGLFVMFLVLLPTKKKDHGLKRHKKIKK